MMEYNTNYPRRNNKRNARYYYRNKRRRERRGNTRRRLVFGSIIFVIALIWVFALELTLSRKSSISQGADPQTNESNTPENTSTTMSETGTPETTTEETTTVQETTESVTVPSTEVQTTLPDTGNHLNGQYDFSKPVPASAEVDNSYFNDAVFIGDSRTDGLIINTGLSNTTSYTYKGLMVDTVFTKPVINYNGAKVSVMDALKTTNFNKVYIMFGINETGWPYNDVFIEKYGKIIDTIKEINPGAIIYVQEILPVTNKVSSTHSYIKNEKINEYNRLLQEMANQKQVYYIDTGSAVAMGDGSLPEDAAIDGIHLNKAYCEKWLYYLKTHTVTQ